MDPDEQDDAVYVDAEEVVRSGRRLSTLGEVVAELVSRRRWHPRLEGAAVFGAWEELVGPGLAARTEPVRLAGGVLVVRAASAAWATEVGYLTSQLRQRADEVLGPGLVEEVRVVVGALRGHSTDLEEGSR